ncbi:MAG TPA: helix-hairpin-helix domain-containing protein [Chitinophagales bacterium]|nr:helix-hairpin-helix domain-containing protein [Chitinophagales bacterium]HNM32292.1 helix-hairpin-helix domain-containing protein [Chitinophagales bacterium]
MNANYKNGFSRFERNGIILLSALIIIAIISKRYVVEYYGRKSEKLIANDTLLIARLQQQITEAKDAEKPYYATPKNTPYPSINSTRQQPADFKIEVNSATEEDFDKLKGIGKVFAGRIVAFRNKLGGFYSIEQIKDVYGIQDSVFQNFKKQLTIKPKNATKIDINTATFEELTANPYLFSTVAKQIIGYRTKVRPFESVEDVKNLYFIKDHPEHYTKMLPYIRVD